MNRLHVLLLASSSLFAQPYDLVIRNGHVIDGTGSPWYSADVAIQNGRIAAIGQLSQIPAKRTLDAQGLTVAPGFIDMLGQSELTILVNPHLPSKIFQGITTEITGEGDSVAPLNDAMKRARHTAYEHLGIQPDWTTFRQYFARLEKQGLGINLASYVGATSVRRMVIGEDDRAPTPSELERMKQLVRDAMRDGAVGLSTALQYAPAPYASTEELIALASESAKLGGIYATHMRSEGDADIRSDRRSDPHRARSQDSGRNLASESRRQEQLGAHARDRRADRKGARGGTRDQRRTPMPTRRGSTIFPRSFRPGRTTAATRS